MPYILNEDRGVYDVLVTTMSANNEGQLNFQITQLLNRYLEKHSLNYSNINAVMGVLACVQQEFYRRVAVPYEQEKCRINGDVF